MHKGLAIWGAALTLVAAPLLAQQAPETSVSPPEPPAALAGPSTETPPPQSSRPPPAPDARPDGSTTAEEDTPEKAEPDAKAQEAPKQAAPATETEAPGQETSAAETSAPESGAAEADTPSETEAASAQPEDAPTDASDATPQKESPTAPDAAERAAFATCTATLKRQGVVFDPLPPVDDADDPACGIALPLKVQEIRPGIALNPDTVLSCEATLALSRWIERVVLPAAEVLPERGGVTGLAHGSAYVCRPRDIDAEGRISEHSRGTAIDIMGITFADGSTLPIEPRERDGTLEEAFQDAIRAGACLSFTTVLGPGTDADHADHLHFDVKERRGGFRLCQ